MCTRNVNGQTFIEMISYPGMVVLKKEKQLFLLFTEVNLLIPGKEKDFSEILKEQDNVLKFNTFEFPIKERTPLPPRSERITTEIDGISISISIERSSRVSRITSVTLN